MKKTLITLAALAMASVAQAAPAVPAAVFSGDTLTDGSSISGIGSSYTMSIVVDWASAIGTGGLGDWQSATLIRAASSQGWWTNGIGLFSNGTGLSAGIKFDDTGLRELTVLGDTDADDGVTVGGANISSNAYDFILTEDHVQDGKLNLFYTYTVSGGQSIQSIYAMKDDGSLAGVQFTRNESNTSADMAKLVLGNMNDAITSVSLYDGVLSVPQIKEAAMANVPEPTTATLSLLALAGLAARRRRK